jgi:hypothetical protein
VKLLPCPFCGTNRTKLVQWPITTENWGAEIRCECGCRGPSGFGKSSIPMACDLWNRREHSIERIKRLEEENDAMRADLLLWNEKEVKP